MTRKDHWCLLLYLTLAVATGFADLRMRAYPQRAATEFSPAVVANTEHAPGKYRVLAPFLDHYLARLSGAAPETVWYTTRLAWIFLAYAIFHAYLRTWFPPEAALTGVATVAASLPLTFTNSWAHPDHVPELALFTLGAMMVARRADWLFGVALAVAALNRETSVFLVLLFLVAEPVSRSRVIRAAVFGLEWFILYAGVRVWRGLEHYDYWQVTRNLADLSIPLPDVYDPYYRAYAYFALVLFGPMIFVAVRAGHLGGAPRFVRRAPLVIPGVALVAFLFSNIIESRIFTPVYALAVPLFIQSLFGASRADHVSRTSTS